MGFSKEELNKSKVAHDMHYGMIVDVDMNVWRPVLEGRLQFLIRCMTERAETAEARCEMLESANRVLSTRITTAEKMVKEYQDVIVPGYRERAEKAEREAKEAQREATICRNGWKKAERERDAAVSDMEDLMCNCVDGCHVCANAIVVHREPCVRLDCELKGRKCNPKWRGAKEE